VEALSNYSSGYQLVKKEERKAKTYFYEGINYSGFDKVINNANPEIGIQYILNLSVKYDLKKSK